MIGKMTAAAAMTALALIGAQPAHAEWQPKGPITLLIGFKAGGAADTQARLVAEELEARKGWRVIPENVAGKGGGVMAARLVKQPADGTAIGMTATTTVGYSVLVSKKPAYTHKDFTYLSSTGTTQVGIIARPDRGWKSMADVAADMKKGRKVSFAVMTPKLADGAYLLGKTLGVQFNLVNVKGGKAVMDGVLAGDIDIGWVAGAQGKSVKAGDLMNLASGEAKRLKVSPNAPTVKELGLDAEFGSLFLFMAPKGLPKDARDAIAGAIAEIVNDPNSKAHKYVVKSLGGIESVSGAALDKYVDELVEGEKAFLAATASK